MNNHYFTDNPDPQNDEKSFTLRIGGEELKFFSNSGMFSHGEPDPNSLMLIRELTRSVKSHKGLKLLDLGCGYGLIGITLGKLFNTDVTMSDVNGNALSYAEKNADINKINAHILKSDGFEEINETFDIITLNPPIHAGKEVCYKLYEETALRLETNGSFYIVIMDKHGKNSHIKKLRDLFPTVDVIKRQNGINIIKCKEDNHAD
ncbi:MAG: methyltransferase [Ruminococcus sp.]|jgi:16S rRNA (guanine1207-N2)-methyltransferase|nr:methyltransferase [Ruminococcus sp.]